MHKKYIVKNLSISEKSLIIINYRVKIVLYEKRGMCLLLRKEWQA